MNPRSNSGRIRQFSLVLVLLGTVLCVAATGFCADVALQTARQAAEAKMLRHIALYGHWNGASEPSIVDYQVVRNNNVVVAYDFKVQPSGHVLVAVDDDLVPIPLYSTRSGFNPDHADNPNAIESWIVPELGGKLGALKEHRRRTAAGVRSLSVSAGQHRINAAWDYFKGQSTAGNQSAAPSRSETSASSSAQGVARGAVLDALMATRWNQDFPYNSQTPENRCFNPPDMPTDNTLTGCVATAWAQVLRYYEWPDASVAGDLGSHSYEWNHQTVWVDFTDAKAYDWANMPYLTEDIDTDEERNAVGWLMKYTGVAAETIYGCSVSSSEIWASDVLDVYFRYKAMELYRKGVGTLPGGKTWFQMFKSELDAGRLVIFTIFSQRGGHEVVADGYQDDTTEMVHINFGWSGYSDGYYDITDADAFTTMLDNWSPNDQYIVVGIEPNPNSELPAVTITSGDQTVNENSPVHLTGSASHSSLAIASYEWLNVGKVGSQKVASITDGDTQEASFTAPYVTKDTDYVFMLKAVDAERGVGYAKCTITVHDIGNSSASAPVSPSSSSRSSSGGCFIESLTDFSVLISVTID